MSATAQPISPTAFAEAVQDLPVGSLHSKAAELQNSINHLCDSNEQLRPFSEEGDQDCTDAIHENKEVIERMQERIRLLRVEVERRGLRWSDDAEDEKKEGEALNNDDDVMDVDAVHGEGERMSGVVNGSGVQRAAGGGEQGRENRRGEGTENGFTETEEDNEQGVHL